MQAQQRGKATYYSRRATGSRTSNGDRLHHDSLTCAHKTYAFGTLLKVTNLDNNKSVIVKVTDRGPYGKGKIIDLSYRAAKEIGMLSTGVAFVEIQVIKDNVIPLRPDDVKFEPMEFDVAESEYDYHHPKWQKGNDQTEEETPKQKKTGVVNHNQKELTSPAPKKHYTK